MKTTALSLLLSLLLSFTALAQPLAESEMRVHFIDVGQGDATLLEFACGAILIDAGGENNGQFNSTEALELYLDEFFANRPDLNNEFMSLMLTHPHIDHTRGVSMVLEKYEVRNAVTNGQLKGSGRYGQIKLHQHVEQQLLMGDTIGFEAVFLDQIGTEGFTSQVIDPINCGSVDPVITVLWGQIRTNPGWSTKEFSNANNHSLVIRIDFGASSLLLTGDLEDHAIEKLLEKFNNTELLDVDVYQVGHHGSKNATTDELVTAMTPEMAVISMGQATREVYWTAWMYGHPNEGVVELLESEIKRPRAAVEVMVGRRSKKFSAKKISNAIYATGWDGTVVLTTNENGDWTYQTAPEMRDLLDINEASFDELVTLPSIGPAKAQAIIDYRTEHGRYSSIQALDDVPGIGPVTILNISEFVVVR